MPEITHDWDDEDYEKTLNDAYDDYRKACYSNMPDIPAIQIMETKQAFLSGIHWLLNRESYCPDDMQVAIRKIVGLPKGD